MLNKSLLLSKSFELSDSLVIHLGFDGTGKFAPILYIVKKSADRKHIKITLNEKTWQKLSVLKHVISDVIDQIFENSDIEVDTIGKNCKVFVKKISMMEPFIEIQRKYTTSRIKVDDWKLIMNSASLIDAFFFWTKPFSTQMESFYKNHYLQTCIQDKIDTVDHDKLTKILPKKNKIFYLLFSYEIEKNMRRHISRHLKKIQLKEEVILHQDVE